MWADHIQPSGNEYRSAKRCFPLAAAWHASTKGHAKEHSRPEIIELKVAPPQKQVAGWRLLFDRFQKTTTCGGRAGGNASIVWPVHAFWKQTPRR